MKKLAIKVVYPKGIVLAIHDTFANAVHQVLTHELFAGHEPVKLQFDGPPTLLRFDRNLFEAYNRGVATYEELVAETQCDGLYRNWLEVAAGNEVIEPGALWILKGKSLTLDDADMHIVLPYNDQSFEAI